MKVTEMGFGPYSGGRESRLIVIENSNGFKAAFTDYAASIVSIWAPDRQGRLDDVVLGYDSAAEYEKWGGSMGAVCGRFANRLRGSGMVLNGREHLLDKNKEHYTIHGGSAGFNKRVWQCEPGVDSVTFTLVSADGDQGFPGELTARAKYSLEEDNSLRLELWAVSTGDTAVNLTNHAYFNLSGHGSGDQRQRIMVNAGFFNPQDSRQLPTGEVLKVDGTPFDLRQFRDVWDVNTSGWEQLACAGGMDHNFLLDKTERGAMELAGALYSEASGRLMEVYTTQPAMMIYTANGLSQRPGKGGAVYGPRGAVCMETQGVPDSMYHTHFPSPVLRAGQEYRQVTEYRFSAVEGI